jgi:nucleotide-binding universal stress UspA family protein
MSRTILCAIADDDRLQDVVDTGRVMAATGRLRPVFVHVGRAAALAPAPVGFGVGEGAAATAHVPQSPADQAREVGAALVEAAGLWDDPAIVATGDPVTELERIGSERDAALVVAGTHGRGLLAGVLHGSVSRGLARTGSRPVLLVRREAVPGLGGPVVCAVDLATKHHVATAAHAARLAEWTERPLVLVHVLRMDLAPVAGGPGRRARPARALGPRAEAAREALEALAAGLPAEDVECAVLDPAPWPRACTSSPATAAPTSSWWARAGAAR